MDGQNETMLEAVMGRLDREKGNLRVIAEMTGIPYSTLTKITRRSVTDPRVSTVQTLFDYFTARPQP